MQEEEDDRAADALASVLAGWNPTQIDYTGATSAGAALVSLAAVDPAIIMDDSEGDAAERKNAASLAAVDPAIIVDDSAVEGAKAKKPTLSPDVMIQ